MFYPDLLTALDGHAVTTPAQWPARQRELLAILEREQYGIRPAWSGKARGQVTDVIAPCCAGRARHERLSVTFDTPSGPFSFPMDFLFPADGRAHPQMLLMNFRPGVYDRYCPAEEIIDNGFALGYICYTDITSDDADMTSGLAGCFPRGDSATEWGKLSMWAFALSRSLEVLLDRPEVDARNAAVIGHSRLGKVALVCGAYDERVRFILANGAGCGGDALEQAKHPGAETYADMAKSFPYWFCGNRARHTGGQTAMLYDQHFLLAAIAPRYVALGSAAQDLWADPYAQQLCCVAASPAWQLHNLPGYIGPETPAEVNATYGDGQIGYHLREGVHYLSRQDWLRYMAFVQRHLATGRKDVTAS